MQPLSIITDPVFYAWAIPAVLMVGLAKSGFLSGFGALATPLLAMAVPVPQAAAILLPLLIIMDFTGVQQMWPQRDHELLALLVPAGLVGTLVGWALFHFVSVPAVSLCVGGLTLLFLAQRLFQSSTANAKPKSALWGRILGVVSGFTSFVAHAGFPPLSAFVLPLRLPPIRVSATLAVFFTFINLSKLGPYAWLGLLDASNLSTSLVLAPLAPLGVWAGVRLTRRVSATWFYRLAYLGMALAAFKLIAEGRPLWH